MIEAKISLPGKLYTRLRRMYGATNSTPDRVIRRALVAVAAEHQAPAKTKLGLAKLAEFGFKGPRDLARNHDQYLYADGPNRRS